MNPASMLDAVWSAYEQTQDEARAAGAAFAGEEAARARREYLRLESKIDALALVCQALWELVREKTDLTEKDIEEKMREIDLRDGRRDAKIDGGRTECPACHRIAHTRQRACMYCGTEITAGHLVEKR